MASRNGPVVGIIGSPVGHSLTPVLQEAAFGALGLGWSTAAFEVEAGGGAAAVEAMRALSIRGLSVTMPLKAEVARSVDRLDPAAASLDSVNCLSLESGEVVGLSTDGAGLLASLRREASMEPAGRRVLIMGAGGAARAVVDAFARAGAASVAVLARRAEAAEACAALAGPAGRVAGHEDAADAEIIVNATPIGMEGTTVHAVAPLVDPSSLGPGQLAVDLVYHPRRTAWLEQAVMSGAQGIGGLGMLVHQAAIQIERWTGLEAPVEEMWAAAERALEAG
jgi:shikimate dehydrogenase